MVVEEWLIDTDILIDFLRGVPQADEFLQTIMPMSLCYISSITIAELYVGVREGNERPILDQFIQEFQVAPLNEIIAKKGGLFRRDYGKSHGTGVVDAIIAATAIEFKAKLATLNKKHYPMLKDIHIPYNGSSIF